MDKYLKLLEEVRIAEDLSKVQMADLMKAPASQNYTNWLKRNSLPKKYFPIAEIIIEKHLGRQAIDSTEEAAILEYLTPEKQVEAAKSLGAGLSPKDHAELAQYFLALAVAEL
jgi:hypothetical protein